MFRPSALPATRPGPRLRLLSRLLNAQMLLRQRSTLARLDDHLLKDIGLTPEQARTEATRPIWDVPAHWRA